MRRFKDATPEAKLNWLEEANQFVNDFVSPQKLERWKKISGRYFCGGVLNEIVEGEVALSLDDALRQNILSGKRKRKLRNITSKLDPLYLLSIKKVATKKGIPYLNPGAAVGRREPSKRAEDSVRRKV
ncbi:MAG: hypothetical protein M0Z89_09740 [Nitrospiraceae bacterium]|nr:hypothetical protein [Nitrospiraceae bacterium]